MCKSERPGLWGPRHALPAGLTQKPTQIQNLPSASPRASAGFIKARPHTAWRETLAAVLTSAPYDQFESLVAILAHRLAAAGAA